jgi:N-acetylglucosaminyldiphosphoundecaprenol N-acetyl-beta-D-mannosaminyltransferase
MIPKQKLMRFKVSLASQGQTVEKLLAYSKSEASQYVCVANVHMLVEAYQNPSFNRVVNNAAVVTSDGKPLTWALRLLYGIRQERVAGMFLMQDLLQAAAAEDLPVFFYGCTKEVLAETKSYLQKTYPALQLGGFISPPFRLLTAEEEESHVQEINASGARLVFVALGCPKQEAWMARMQGRINAVMIGVGAALPVMVGLRQKAPMWIQNSGMEWLFRLSLEPRRLFRRYTVTNTIFLYLLTKEFIRIRLFKQQPVLSSLEDRLPQVVTLSQNISRENRQESIRV